MFFFRQWENYRGTSKTLKLFLPGSLVFLPFVFFSCASISPVNQQKEIPLSFEIIDDIIPQWQTYAHNIGYIHVKIKNPRLELWALRIILEGAGIAQIAVMAGNDEGVKVSDFVRDNNLTAGINAVPFDILDGKLIKNMGIVISDGKLLAPVNPRYDALVFYTDGSAAIEHQAEIVSTENIINAVGGFHRILKNGDVLEPPPNRLRRHPRTAAGIKGSTLYLLVIDGRRGASIGATETETARILRALGAAEGINLDGGGSTTLALRHGGKVRVVNKPADGIFGSERAVAGCLGVNPSREK
jgi:hypothetical protein